MATKKSRGVDANELGNDPIDDVEDQTEEQTADTNPSQPEDTSDTKAAADYASFHVEDESLAIEANAPDQEQAAEPGQPQPLTDGEVELPLGLSVADIIWWNNSQNRNYMAGDGPQAGITEVDGSAQSASSVDPEIRAETLKQSREEVGNAQANPSPVEG